MTRRELKVVRLIEPDLCTGCRFSNRAEVDLEDGRRQIMVRCTRLDCDNWDILSAESPLGVHPEAA